MLMQTAAAAATLASALILAAPSQAAEQLVWSTDFETNTVFKNVGPFEQASRSHAAGGATITNAGTLPGFGNRYLRNAGTGTTSFTVTGLGAHDSIRLRFDLALLDSWDSPTDTRWGPDYLYVTVDNTTYTWAPAWPGTLVGRGAYAQTAGWQDSVYAHEFVINHWSDSFTFAVRAGGRGYQGGGDESWGLDNISVSANAIPEPATWAMFIIGFGFVGAAMRRGAHALQPVRVIG